MTSPLDNLLKVSKGGLKQEAPSQSEFDVQLLRERDTVAGQLEATVEALGPIKPTT